MCEQIVSSFFIVADASSHPPFTGTAGCSSSNEPLRRYSLRLSADIIIFLPTRTAWTLRSSQAGIGIASIACMLFALTQPKALWERQWCGTRFELDLSLSRDVMVPHGMSPLPLASHREGCFFLPFKSIPFKGEKKHYVENPLVKYAEKRFF